jgi:hypothetical protein
MFALIPQARLAKLSGAASNLQSLLDDGTLAAAFNRPESDPHSAQLAVTAFDVLAEHNALLLAEQKAVSPFLRYRREILAEGVTPRRLRGLVLNLWNGGGEPNLSALFIGADEHHTRIALECVVSYTQQGENDRHFMDLAVDVRSVQIREIEQVGA